MIENSQNPEDMLEIDPVVFDFQNGVKRAENFGELYHFFRSLSDGFFGDDGKKYSAKELEELTEWVFKNFFENRIKDITKLSKIDKILGQKVLDLMDGWWSRRADMEQDA